MNTILQEFIANLTGYDVEITFTERNNTSQRNEITFTERNNTSQRNEVILHSPSNVEYRFHQPNLRPAPTHRQIVPHINEPHFRQSQVPVSSVQRRRRREYRPRVQELSITNQLYTCDDDECCICMEAYSRPNKSDCKLPCSHIFCVDCVKRINNKKCPICRQSFTGYILPIEYVNPTYRQFNKQGVRLLHCEEKKEFYLETQPHVAGMKIGTSYIHHNRVISKKTTRMTYSRLRNIQNAE